MSIGTNALQAWTFTPNYSLPQSSVVTQLPNLAVPSFNRACGGGACVPQLGTKQQLDTLGDRLMYRLAYRKVGTTNYLVATHSVNPGTTGLGVAGIRWYQLTATGRNAFVGDRQPGNVRPG